MRMLVSILLMFCFVSVSALASHGRAVAALPAIELQENQALADIDAAPPGVPVTDIDKADGKKPCACKDKADSLTLTCGVTLALSDDDASGYLAAAKQAWFAFTRPDRNRQMMYLLRRPPRTVL